MGRGRWGVRTPRMTLHNEQAPWGWLGVGGGVATLEGCFQAQPASAIILTVPGVIPCRTSRCCSCSATPGTWSATSTQVCYLLGAARQLRFDAAWRHASAPARAPAARVCCSHAQLAAHAAGPLPYAALQGCWTRRPCRQNWQAPCLGRGGAGSWQTSCAGSGGNAARRLPCSTTHG
jgi:hypothetical protein